MKFDRTTLATVLAVSAAALAGCDQRQCVDAKGKVVPDSNCTGTTNNTTSAHTGGAHPGFVFVPLFFGSRIFGGGSRGFGGGAAPAVSRGGFGGEGGGGHGGGGGE